MHAILRLAVLGFLIAGSLANNGPSGSGPNSASVLSVRIWQAARFAVSQLGEGHELMWIRRYEWSQVRFDYFGQPILYNVYANQYQRHKDISMTCIIHCGLTSCRVNIQIISTAWYIHSCT